MRLNEVLFVGGDVDRLASVKIRCREIASRLGCDVHFRAKTAEEVPAGYKLYLCVKPELHEPELHKLRQRALLAWDILDHEPPRGDWVYLASTALAARTFAELGAVHVIHHHHCNDDRVRRHSLGRAVVWIGHRQWYPELGNVAHECRFVDGMGRQEVVGYYRSGDIVLNLRKATEITARHVELNSGLKLINCIGFGLPSISAPEPAYQEVGGDCTVFSSTEECGRWVEMLKEDEGAYRRLQANCWAAAEDFHVDRIVDKYRRLIESL